MPVGDDAVGAGLPLVPPDAEVGDGYIEINRTRDEVAQARALVLNVWPVARGGTGAANAAGARTNLGISTGTAAPSDVVGGATDGNIYIQIQT